MAPLSVIVSLTLVTMVCAVHPAPLDIDITAGSDVSGSSAYPSGAEIHTITHDERSVFDIHDQKLKYCIGKYFGAEPDHAYLHSPTHHNLYETNGWPQVEIVLQPTSAELESVHHKATYLKTDTLYNPSSSAAAFTSTLETEVSNTVENSWSQTHGISVSKSVNVGVTVKAIEIGGEISFSTSSEFGKSGTQAVSSTVRSSNFVSLTLQPGEARRVVLSAQQADTIVKVTYTARLTGMMAINYGGRHNGHHFWALDINSVMHACGLPTTHTVEQRITTNAYTDGRTALYDHHSGRQAVRAELFGLISSVPRRRRRTACDDTLSLANQL